MSILQRRSEPGFTVLELLVAVLILAAVTTLAYMTFATVTTAWKKGMALSEELNHGEFVMEQLAMGLRSAYYPDAGGGGKPSVYGFMEDDGGDGENATDMITWVKKGPALVGRDCPYAGTPHRIRFTLEDNLNGGKAVAVRSWRVQGQMEDFDPENIKPVYLSTKVVGFNCRTSYRRVGDEIEWLDTWKETNRLPRAVEITLYMEPLAEGEKAVEVKRVLEIPVAPLSWQ